MSDDLTATGGHKVESLFGHCKLLLGVQVHISIYIIYKSYKKIHQHTQKILQEHFHIAQEQMAVENGGKLQKVPFLKSFFLSIAPLGDPEKQSHIKVKSKICYLGEKMASYQGKWLSNWQLKSM